MDFFKKERLFFGKKKLYNSKEIFLYGCREKKCEFDEL